MGGIALDGWPGNASMRKWESYKNLNSLREQPWSYMEEEVLKQKVVRAKPKLDAYLACLDEMNKEKS